MGALRRLDARVSGRVDWRREQAADGSLSAQLRLRDAAVRLDELSLRGPLELNLALTSSTVEGPTGRFELDAGQAEVDYGGVARKAPGIPATLSGRIVDRRVEMARLHVEGFEATLSPGAGFSPFGRNAPQPFFLVRWAGGAGGPAEEQLAPIRRPNNRGDLLRRRHSEQLPHLPACGRHDQQNVRVENAARAVLRLVL